MVLQAGGHEGDFVAGDDGKIKKKVSPAERKFYESLENENAFLRDYVPRFFGTEQDGDKNYVVMEDITAGMKYPCIMDVKMGTSSVGEDADPEKADSMREKDMSTTTHSLGIRIVGMQYHDLNNNMEVVTHKKPWGKELTDTTIVKGLREYFNTPAMCTRVVPAALNSLNQIRSVMQNQYTSRIYSSSILFAYDADIENTTTPKLRMIDFAHVFPIKEEGERDERYLTGLNNLIRILQGFAREDNHEDDA